MHEIRDYQPMCSVNVRSTRKGKLGTDCSSKRINHFYAPWMVDSSFHNTGQGEDPSNRITNRDIKGPECATPYEHGPTARNFAL